VANHRARNTVSCGRQANWGDQKMANTDRETRADIRAGKTEN